MGGLWHCFTHIKYGKSPCLMYKSTISMTMFNSFVSLPDATSSLPTVIYITPKSWVVDRSRPALGPRREPESVPAPVPSDTSVHKPWDVTWKMAWLHVMWLDKPFLFVFFLTGWERDFFIRCDHQQNIYIYIFVCKISEQNVNQQGFWTLLMVSV